MPKPMRRDRRSVAFLSRLDAFYDLTTKVADHEAAVRELKAVDTGSQSRATPPMILQEQADLVAKARKLAAPARGLSPPRVRRHDLSKKKLTARLRTRSATLARKITTSRHGAAEEGRDVKELHRLRRDSRSLRYTIEFFERSKDCSTLSQQLRTIQDSLGSVRDCDGALRLLRRCGASNLDPAFVRLTSKRRAMYASFARTRAESLDGVRALAKLT